MTEEEIFIEAIEIADRAKRREYLEDACAGDASLRASVDELLSMHDTAGDFLETPALETGGPVDGEEPGTVIDRYRLIERIGEGGFGDVWKAEQQEPVRRLVALKVIKPGMDTRRVIARFEAERQVLAMMNHRNIAAVLDAGSTERGRPYFVMELVDGLSIDSYCDQLSMPVRERLVLFAQICRAVQHAHQKGIVHRDLKPSNILVASRDNHADAKVIDFGIAKAMQNPAGLNLTATAPQQLMGTPEYMSPEQIAGESDIDTRADIYALGGVLYKLLVGVAPLDVVAARKSGLQELARTIREDDAPRPSTRILQLSEAARIAEQRGTQAEALSRSLKGDLDAIVTKSLAKERARRYGSASDLASDIERYLACEPVSAAAPGVLYRIQKFVRRNRVPVVATILVMTAVIAGSIMAAVGLVSADRAQRNEANLRRQAALKDEVAKYQRKLARAKADEALRIAAVLEGIVSGASPRSGRQIELTRQQLDEFAESLEGELTEFPDIEARLRRTIGRAYLDLIEIRLSGSNLRRALDLRKDLYPPDNELVLQSRIDYALFLVADSRLDEAEEQIDKTLPALRATDPSVPLIRAVSCLGRLRRVQENFAEGERLAQEAWELAQQVHGPDSPLTIEYQAGAAYAAYLANRNRRDAEERLKEPERRLRDALDRLISEWPEREFEITSTKGRLARLLINRGRIVEARDLMEAVIAHRRSTLGEDSKYLVSDLLAMSQILSAEENHAEAEEVIREALEMADRVKDERQQLRGHVLYRLSVVLGRDRPQEAAEWHSKAIDAWHSCLGNHLTVAVQRRRLAEQLRSLGRWQEAEKALLQSMEVLDHHEGKQQARATTHHRLADLLRTADERQRAVEHLRQAIELHIPRSILSVVAYIDCIETLLEMGKVDEARQLGLQWAANAEHTGSYQVITMSRLTEPQLLMADGEYEKARALLEEIHDDVPENLVRMRGRVQALLAKCLIGLKSFEAAESILLAQSGARSMRLHPLEPRRVARQLVDLYEAWDKPEKAAQWREPAAR